jgi:hypothetical protein
MSSTLLGTPKRRSARALAQRARVLVRLSSKRDFESVTLRVLTQGGDTGECEVASYRWQLAQHS